MPLYIFLLFIVFVILAVSIGNTVLFKRFLAKFGYREWEYYSEMLNIDDELHIRICNITGKTQVFDEPSQKFIDYVEKDRQI